jgi:endonuclease-3 related protein
MRRKGAQAAMIREIFRTMETALGPQHWWPAGSAFEVVAGAYLTQNTAWTNVEKAMGNLRRAGVLSVAGIRNTPLEELEQLVRPSGYFRQKAARLKRFIAHLDASHGGSLEEMFAQPAEALRKELLGLPGIGRETADSIRLYAASCEVFVVDSYTRRIFERHELVESEADYDEIRLGVERALAGDCGTPHPGLDAEISIAKAPPTEDGRREDRAPVPHLPSEASAMERSELSRRYNEFHALLVQTAKHYCVKGMPRCERCPLRSLLPPGSEYRRSASRNSKQNKQNS